MMLRPLWNLVLMVVATLSVGGDRAIASTGATAFHSSPSLQASYGHIPLYFEVNQGQADEVVKFLARGSGYALALTVHEAILTLQGTGNGEQGTATLGQTRSLAPDHRSLATLRMQLVGANATPAITGLAELPGKTNYFVGKDPAQWRTNIPTYGKVKYEQVYPGIDLVYYGNQQQLEYDFIVQPGADPKAIRWAFAGTTAQMPLRIDEAGDLVLPTVAGDVRFHRPHLYQEIDGIKKEIAGRYVIVDSEETEGTSLQSPASSPQIGFEVASYDTSKPLIIDPVLSYVTVLKQGFFKGLARDPEGNLYLTGGTSSPETFPTTEGALRSGTYWNAVVVKLSPTGTVLYSSYFGGSDVDEGNDIAVDSAGNAYVTGLTYSADFPVSENAPRKNCLRDDAEENGCGELLLSN